MARLDGGSFLSKIGELTVRIIPADVTVTCADGTRYTGCYRLATTLLDHHRYPATALTSGGNTRSPTWRCGTPS